jgi:molybdenum cofactor biosynthesis protein B
MSVKPDAVFVPLNIAVLTVSDTRSYANDTSGELLASRAVEVGHRLIARELLKDDLYKIRAQVATWIADEQVQVVLITGGTALPAATVHPKRSSACWTSASMVLASCSARCRSSILALRPCRAGRWPGWPTAPWCAACRARPGRAGRRGRILAEQLDARHRPCNFVAHLKPIGQCESRG